MNKKLSLISLLCLSFCCTALTACWTGGHAHTVEKVSGVSATCQTDGNIEYYRCTDCDKLFSDEAASTEITKESTVIKNLGHDIEHHDAKAPSYTEKGHAAYDTCKRDGCDYTTYQEIDKLVAVSEVEVVASDPLFVGNLLVGDEAVLTANVLPENAADKTIVWTSSDDSVATVENGTVTAVSAGTATIKATASDVGTVYGEYTVTVSAKKSVFDGTKAVMVGCSYNTTEGCIGNIGNGSIIKFKVYSESAQTVNLQLDVTVNTNVHASYKKHFASITVGGTIVSPADDRIASKTLGDTEVDWTNHGIIALNGVELVAGENEIVITAAEAPSTNVFSLTVYGEKEVGEVVADAPIAEGTEYFFEGEDAVISGNGINVKRDDAGAKNNTSLQGINDNKGATLTYKVTTDKDVKAGLYLNLAFGGSTVSNIFTLTVNGEAVDIPSSFTAQGTANWVTFEEYWLANVDLKAGQSNVIVLTVTGGCGNYDYMKLICKDATLAAVVDINVENVKLTTTKELLKVNDTVQISSVITPANATETITWTSSDTSVATVYEDGTVTALKAGYADITATAGGKSSTIRIFVTDSNGTKYEAENASLNGCTVEGNGIYVGGWSEGKSVTFTVDGNEGGKVLLRIYTSVVHGDKTDDINKYYTVKVNGQNIDLSQGTFAHNGTTGWNTEGGYYTVEITLQSGNNTIELCGVAGVATTLDGIVIY